LIANISGTDQAIRQAENGVMN